MGDTGDLPLDSYDSGYKPAPTRSPAYLPNYPGAGMQFVCPAHLEVPSEREYKLYIGIYYRLLITDCCNYLLTYDFEEFPFHFIKYDIKSSF